MVVLTAKEQGYCQEKLEKVLFIEIMAVQWGLTTLGVIKVNKLLNLVRL